jgi:hypothetical protein
MLLDINVMTLSQCVMANVHLDVMSVFTTQI